MAPAARQHHVEWTADGSLYCPSFSDVYHSADDGLAEAEHVFLGGNDLPTRFAANALQFTIGELGFGTGLNFLAAWRLFHDVAHDSAQLDFVSIEKFPLEPVVIAESLRRWPCLHEQTRQLLDRYPPLHEGMHRIMLDNNRVRLTLCIGDVAEVLPELCFCADAWFLDGFAPARNPDMWSIDVMHSIAQLMKPGATVATYSAAGEVRRALAGAGVAVERTGGFGRKRHMLRGVLTGQTDPSRHVPPWYRQTNVEPSDSRSAIVIGAGLAGSACARALADRGWRVNVVERASIGAGASGNRCALFAPTFGNDEDPIARYGEAGCRIAEHWIDRFADIIELHRCNLCDAACDNESTALRGGTVNASLLCSALLDHPQIVVDIGFAAARLEHASGNWHLFDANGHERHSPIVIIANAMAATALDPLRCLPLTPVRGQVTYLPATSASRHITNIHMLGDGYLTPADSRGFHTLGATFDRDVDDPAAAPTDNERNIERLRAHAPHLARDLRVDEHDPASLACWANVRATLPDRLPAVGPVPDHAAFMRDFADLQHGRPMSRYPDATWLDGLYCSVGHGARGVVSSLFAAEIIAAQITCTPPPAPLSMLHTLSPARFIIRDLRRQRFERASPVS